VKVWGGSGERVGRMKDAGVEEGWRPGRELVEWLVLTTPFEEWIYSSMIGI
jgi:hypothetical protein